MKVALYLRVSTREQVENYSLSNQEEKLRAYAKAKGFIVGEVYKDGGHSGANLDRPALSDMLKNIHKYDAVMVYKLDRLSRSQRHTLELIDDFINHDVEFISVTESLDTSTPMGRAMIGIMGAFAQLERELFAERSKDGQIKRAQAGYATMGGNHDPAGFKRQDGELITKEDEKQHIIEAFKLYAQFHSITKVQAELKLKGYKVWRFRRYNDLLRNPLYNGKFRYSGEVYEGNHEKIIDDKLFNEVQSLIKRHRGNNFNKARESLLAGMMTCSHCGERYLTINSYHTNPEGDRIVYRYYLCRARRFPSEYDKKCMNKIWSNKEIENLITKEMQLLGTKQNEGKEEIKIDYTQLINNVDKKIERLIELYTNENIDIEILDKRMEKLNEEKDSLLESKYNQQQADSPFEYKDVESYLVSLERAEFKEKRAIVEKLIEQIYVDDDTIKIDWNFAI